MTTTDDTTTVRLSGRTGLLAAIPALLGFHPQESLVMVCLSGLRRRVGPVIRVDLPDPRAAPDHLIDELRQHARRHSDEVALICYTEKDDRPALLEAVRAVLESGGTAVLDALLVRDGRAVPVSRSVPSSGAREHPDPGFELPGADHPQAQTMAAAAALHGRGILPDRQALRDSIAGPSGAAARRSSAALRAAASGLAANIGRTGPLDRAKLHAMTAVAVELGLAEVTGGAGVAPSTCASIALLLCDVEIRDAVIARSVEESNAPWVPMLAAVARATADEDAAEVCAVLAMAAYRRGDGALAQVAVDRCLTAEPHHRLAHLMLNVMAAGLPPAQLAELAGKGSISPGTDE